MKVTGTQRIFINEYNGKKYYKTGIKGQDQDRKEKWNNIDVFFIGCEAPTEEKTIEIEDGSLAFNTDKNGYTHDVVFVRQYNDNVVNTKAVKEADIPTDYGTNLPF